MAESERPTGAGAGAEVASAEPAAGSADVQGPAELSARDRAVLDVAALTYARPGLRERAVRERLGMSPTAYFQLLNALLDDPCALAYEPVTVNRLRRERERRRDER